MALLGDQMWWKKCNHPDNSCFPATYPPKYSSDISAAMEVQAKMASLGHYFSLDYDLCAWTATFINADSRRAYSVNTTKSNPAEEICRAALLATLPE